MGLGPGLGSLRGASAQMLMMMAVVMAQVGRASKKQPRSQRGDYELCNTCVADGLLDCFVALVDEPAVRVETRRGRGRH